MTEPQRRRRERMLCHRSFGYSTHLLFGTDLYIRRCNLSTLYLGRSFVFVEGTTINQLINVQVDAYIRIRSSLKTPKMYSSKTVQKQVFLQMRIDKVRKMK
nr:unnamed protein product [Callosobruchus analis]